MNFLRSMRATATTPRTGYTPLSPAELNAPAHNATAFITGKSHGILCAMKYYLRLQAALHTASAD